MVLSLKNNIAPYLWRCEFAAQPMKYYYCVCVLVAERPGEALHLCLLSSFPFWHLNRCSNQIFWNKFWCASTDFASSIAALEVLCVLYTYIKLPELCTGHPGFAYDCVVETFLLAVSLPLGKSFVPSWDVSFSHVWKRSLMQKYLADVEVIVLFGLWIWLTNSIMGAEM